MAHWDALLPGYVLHLHYTDVVRDVEAATRRLAAHCGLAYDPAMLRFYETQRAVQTASQLQVRSRCRRAGAGAGLAGAPCRQSVKHRLLLCALAHTAPAPAPFPPAPPAPQVRKPIYSSSLNKWQAYSTGLAPLLLEVRRLRLQVGRGRRRCRQATAIRQLAWREVELTHAPAAPLATLQLRGTILGYEERAGLASSRAALDELAAQQAQQAQQQAGSEAAAAGSGSPRDEL